MRQRAAACKCVDGASIRARRKQAIFSLRSRASSFDGHRFVAAAFERGAAAAVVSEPVEAPGPLLRVDDTVTALQNLARAARAIAGGSR